jgi:hypothetical protein
MKSMDVGQFSENLHQVLQDSLSEAIVITQAGKPCALVHGLNYDEEDLQLIKSKEFWSMIRESRKRPTIPLEVAEKRLRDLDYSQVLTRAPMNR